MAEIDKICDGKIKHDGIFDFKEIYNFLYKWLKDSNYDVEEKSYTEKVKAEGKEIEVNWVARRTISDYFRFQIKILIRVTGMINVETMKEGVKVKMNKGLLDIGVTSYLEKDYEHRWEALALLKFMRGIYDKFIIKSRVEQYEEKIAEETDEMIAQTKAFLALEIH